MNKQHTQQQDSSTEQEVWFEASHECNLIDECFSDEEDDMPDLVTRYNSDSKSDNSDEKDDDEMSDLVTRYNLDDNNKLDAAYLLHNRPSVKPSGKIMKARASVIFSLVDKNGERKEYLGLLDTGSTSSLITK